MPTRLRAQIIVDDWGLSPAINEAAVALLRAKQLYGTSVMPFSRFFLIHKEELVQSDAKIGCHLNLTFDVQERGSPKNSSWRDVAMQVGRAVWSGSIRSESILDVFRRQCSWIQEEFGRLDYIDGHHHIHLYPGIVGITRQVAHELNVPVRLVEDRHFRFNWGLAQVAKQQLKETSLFSCEYLQERDLLSKESLIEKLNKTEKPIVAHPATCLDFEEHQVRDHMTVQRVKEFQLLSEVLSL